MLLACFAVFNIEKLDEIIKDIYLLAKNIDQQSTDLSAKAQKWAQRDYSRLVIIGSSYYKGLAREAALKTLELTAGNVCTNSDSALSFRHGPKSVVNKHTLLVHLISSDPLTAHYDMDLLKEINSEKNGNLIIALSGNDIHLQTDENIVIPLNGYGITGGICYGINCLIFCQILAMYKSINLGIPTDNPVFTGKLSRVVSGVTLYEMAGGF
jgi:tagatose-6-phosphate ketose/aldose isomerase